MNCRKKLLLPQMFELQFGSADPKDPQFPKHFICCPTEKSTNGADMVWPLVYAFPVRACMTQVRTEVKLLPPPLTCHYWHTTPASQPPPPLTFVAKLQRNFLSRAPCLLPRSAPGNVSILLLSVQISSCWSLQALGTDSKTLFATFTKDSVIPSLGV